MPEYLSPGVYVEEISTGPRPIAGVATSIAGMVGVTARGPESGKPRLVTSMLDFHRLFGGFLTPPDKAGTDAADDRGIRWWLLPLAVKGFFDNGGQKLFIKRVVPAPADAQAAAWALKPAAEQKPAPGATDFELLVEATHPGAGGNDLRFDVRAVEAGRFPLVVADPPDPAPDAPPPDPAKVVVAQKGGLKTGVWVVLIRATGVGDPTFHLLADDGSPAAQGGFEFTLAPAAPAPAVTKGDTLVQVDFEAAVREVSAGTPPVTETFRAANLKALAEEVVDRSNYVTVTTGAPARLKAAVPAALPPAKLFKPFIGLALAKGSAGEGSLTAADYVGLDGGSGRRTGIQALEDIDEVAMCAVPGVWNGTVLDGLITHCTALGDRFAVLDGPPNADLEGIRDFRAALSTDRAALYYPWLRVPDPGGAAAPAAAPPSGHLIGVYARTDVERGVHKAPANTVLRGVIPGTGLAADITRREQDLLNPRGINALRAFPNLGQRVWGARTLSDDTRWQYVNVRRLFLFIEESIDEGLQWVVFEPNAEQLWASVRQSITAFLTTVWHSGALAGTTPEEAFHVACDRTTMTEDDLAQGRLICEVAVAPVFPAEFVIVRIQQATRESLTA
ncbi:phage tail sheath family protein [Streptomyces chartreusis]|uniref:phage tail sheath family protein n=1 Tax=Streptomyces chartreusis TaxID=1969 RepID=UPI0036C63D8C